MAALILLVEKVLHHLKLKPNIATEADSMAVHFAHPQVGQSEKPQLEAGTTDIFPGSFDLCVKVLHVFSEE